MKSHGLLIAVIGVALVGCGGDGPVGMRSDGATQVQIALNGSLQNPAWSPDGNALLLTRFLRGYNDTEGPADLIIVNLATHHLTTLVSDGFANINLPGSCWNPTTREIVYASTREPHDEIYIVDEEGNAIRQITSRDDYVAYEPSLSPDGQHVVFESHRVDVEGNGVIMKSPVNGPGGYEPLTDATEDCRQPNWSPRGDLIAYQKPENAQWDIWVVSPEGTGRRKVTGGLGNKTDPSFSPDGTKIVFSFEPVGASSANLYFIPVGGGTPTRVTTFSGYDGAPSWSSDGTRIIFESCEGDPDLSAGTTLWIIDAP